MKLFSLSLLLILSFIIIGGCISSSPYVNVTSTPSPTPLDPGYKIYTNDTFNFSIEYPANWMIKEGGQDPYSNPPTSVIDVVSFYPPSDNWSSIYDCVTVAFDRFPQNSSSDLPVSDYLHYGLKYYYDNELPYHTGYGGVLTNVSIYPAVKADYAYYYERYTKLQGITYFIPVKHHEGENYKYRPGIFRLVYRTSDATFDNHLKIAQLMFDTFYIK